MTRSRDILPRLKSWASHARLRWFGNLRLLPDTPMGVPRPRYSYPVKDSELSGCFTSVEVSEGFDTRQTSPVAFDAAIPTGIMCC